MRVEWSKSKARAERWREEVILLSEEMRRVLVYFEWKARWWMIQGPRRAANRPDIQEGIIAYSAKQTAIYNDLAKSFATQWYPFMHSHSLPTNWPAHCLPETLPHTPMDITHDSQ